MSMNPEAMAKAVSEAMDVALEPLVSRLETLERQVAQLEERSGVKYCGTWKTGEAYGLGDAATYAGSLWVSKLQHNKAVPGQDGGVAWQLAVKRGADGKDLR